ncbi:DUF6270 domain-containing protein [Roseomonas marmotae]|uniref:DUF616 domain-containing protein n=1 Tax=Roseomonas marmotae TaxID=2768161 RepID=A0ABS3K9N2_9PROT|nr:DUF6270 domain-containing protein [Roseomonas marmotae]MBO1074168.1 hypothetical protein [Roseomonas marmotae]QTI78944.1 hypothetical protein IAI58_15045 [Roseomonas marmotae]
MRFDIFGSCVSRDPFDFLAPTGHDVLFYAARQSFVGLRDEPVRYDPAWYADLPPFERRCVFMDLEKSEEYFRFSADADYLIVDFIDERFDLMQVGSSHVAATRHVLKEPFLAFHQDRLQRRRRLHPPILDDWRRGAEYFMERATRRFAPERIILHEARWSSHFRTVEGELLPFDEKVRARVAPSNELLKHYHENFRALLPSCLTLRVPDEFLFADPQHRWSKEPFHYIPAYYSAFLDLLNQAVEKNRC